MNELIQKHDNRATIRWKLLTSASALALIGALASAPKARAADNDADHPIVWIDLGGQLERADYGADLPAPPFASDITAPFRSPVSIDKPPPYSFAGEVGISFQPAGSDWIFSASLRYGRSSGKRDVHDQTAQILHKYEGYAVHYTHYTAQVNNVVDTRAKHREDHMILDFQAGKDMGLGLFNSDGSSTLSAGVRIAQFTSRASTLVRAKPDVQFYNYYPSSFPPSLHYLPIAHYHMFSLSAQTRDKFRGIGPSISWSASQPLAGNEKASEISFDFGLNAAVLFGRQKRFIRHETKAGYVQDRYYPDKYQQLYQHSASHDRSVSVTVPNIGGFAGFSFRYADAKVSFGYRADFFYKAIDGGVDARKTENLAFYGPFASISIGIGD